MAGDEVWARAFAKRLRESLRLFAILEPQRGDARLPRDHDARVDAVVVEPDVAHVAARDLVVAERERAVVDGDVHRARAEAPPDRARDERREQHDHREQLQRDGAAKDDDERRRDVDPNGPPLDLDVERQRLAHGSSAIRSALDLRTRP